MSAYQALAGRVGQTASVLPRALRLLRRITTRLRGLWLKLCLTADGARVGKRLSVGRGVRVSTTRGARWEIGDRVTLGTGVILSVGKRADIIIGNDVRIMHYTLIGVESSMSIEDRAQIGEQCSIRDHDHDTSAFSMQAAPVICSPVSIGEDSWIGRGVAVLKGSKVGNGAIVGANAVVRGDIPQNAIAVGIPARVVKSRRSQL